MTYLNERSRYHPLSIHPTSREPPRIRRGSRQNPKGAIGVGGHTTTMTSRPFRRSSKVLSSLRLGSFGRRGAWQAKHDKGRAEKAKSTMSNVMEGHFLFFCCSALLDPQRSKKKEGQRSGSGLGAISTYTFDVPREICKMMMN